MRPRPVLARTRRALSLVYIGIVFLSRDDAGYLSTKPWELQFELGSPVGVGPDVGVATLRFAPPRPNPSSAGVTFVFSLPGEAATSLEIFDILGRRVRSWRWTSLQPGGHSVARDGQGKSGRRLMTGIYVCRLTFADQRQQWKLLLRR